jgi:hypothetical protein
MAISDKAYREFEFVIGLQFHQPETVPSKEIEWEVAYTLAPVSSKMAESTMGE